MDSGLNCPWAEHHITVSSSGTISPCCFSIPVIDEATNSAYNIKTHTVSQAFNSAEFKQIRSNLNDGVQDSHCNTCWQLENNNERSLRQETIGEYDEVYQSGKTSGLLTLQLDLSNQCNLKCRTCSPSASSMWVKEHFDIYKTDSVVPIEFQKTHTYMLKDQIFINDLTDNVIANLAVLKFQGGEPLLMKQHWNILDTIIQQDRAKDLVVMYHTNGTVWDDRAEQVLSKFQEVILCLSIDDVGNRFEYIRHPGNWESVKSNVAKIQNWCNQSSDSRATSINCVVSPYNVLTINDMIEFCIDNNLPLQLHAAHTPEYFSLSTLPKYIKDRVLKKLQSKQYPELYQDEVDNIVNAINANSSSEERWKEFLQVTEQHDNYRGESFEKTFPELNSIMIEQLNQSS